MFVHIICLYYKIAFQGIFQVWGAFGAYHYYTTSKYSVLKTDLVDQGILWKRPFQWMIAICLNVSYFLLEHTKTDLIFQVPRRKT